MAEHEVCSAFLGYMVENNTTLTKTKQLTQGALLLSIYFLALVIDKLSLGIASGFLLYLYPLPFIIYGVKYGLKPIIPMFLTGLIATLFLAHITSIFYCVSALVVATYCSVMIYYKKAKPLIVITTVIISVLMSLLSFTTLGAMLGIDIVADISLIQETLDKIVKPMYTEANMVELYDYLMSQMLKVFLIVSEIIIGVVQGVVFYLICKVVEKKLKQYDGKL